MAAITPRMTAANTFGGERATGQGAVRLDGFQRILRASGREPATTGTE